LQDKGVYDELKLSYDFGSSQKISAKSEFQEEQKTIQLVLERLDAKVIKIAQRESLMWNTEQQKAIEFGNILHEIMSFIFSKEDVEVAILKAIGNGLITASQKDFFQDKITQIIKNKELECFFDGIGIVYNEETILKNSFGNSKPDRVVVKGKEAYLLDYKTGDKKDVYKKQIKEYALALQEMNLNVVKKALVYIGEKIEIVLL
jgi:ATP-dependent exoDNAse (exonuclease V) beta subunit